MLVKEAIPCPLCTYSAKHAAERLSDVQKPYYILVMDVAKTEH